MGRKPKMALALLAATSLGALSACSSDSSTAATGDTTSASPASTSAVPCETPEQGTGNPVAATEKDFAIGLDAKSSGSGETTFNVHNEGASTHEFVVFETDLAEDALPVGDDGNVDEEGEGVEHIDEIEDIGNGCDASLTVDLDPGNYVVICNIPGHYAAGMHATLTIK